VHLLPAGAAIETVDGRGPYRVADLARLAADSLGAGDRLPIDEAHATDLAAPEGRPAPARGWIVGLEARADGVWGRVEWTETGRQLLAEKAYRFLSPVIRHLKDGTVTAILRAALVNTPNLRGLAALNSQEPTMDFLAKLRAALGLKDDADEAAALDATGYGARGRCWRLSLNDRLSRPPRSVHQLRACDPNISAH
jgi:phage I-like protein